MRHTKVAFTLLELLAAIAIIGLLAGGSLIYFSVAREKARDTQRLSDVRSLSSALELYYRDEGRYPSTLDFGKALVSPSTGKVYLERVPSNPRPYPDGNCPNEDYGYGSNISGSAYVIDFCLGSAVGEYGPGTVLSEPSGISNFSCGSSTIFYDGGPWNGSGGLRGGNGYYRTVAINGQCWLRDNLNTAMKPDGSTMSSLSDGSDRDCTDLYSRGTESDCLVGRVMYQGNMVLNGGSSGARGICPPRWHVPTDNDWYNLENYLKDEGAGCDAARPSGTWDCDGAGTKLKDGGASGFDALLVGWRTGGDNFSGQENFANFWASDNDGGPLLNRVVQTSGGGDDGKTNRAANDPGYFAFPVRCIKDVE